jgi:hypothetical protein
MLRAASLALLSLVACASDPDGGIGAGTRGIACGSLTCQAGTSVCCVRPATAAYSCEAIDGGCPLSAGSYACDGPEDCDTGLSCCGYSGRMGTLCAGGSCFSNPIICHTNADCPMSQPNCCALDNGYRMCGASTCR